MWRLASKVLPAQKTSLTPPQKAPSSSAWIFFYAGDSRWSWCCFPWEEVFLGAEGRWVRQAVVPQSILPLLPLGCRIAFSTCERKWEEQI